MLTELCAGWRAHAEARTGQGLRPFDLPSLSLALVPLSVTALLWPQGYRAGLILVALLVGSDVACRAALAVLSGAGSDCRYWVRRAGSLVSGLVRGDPTVLLRRSFFDMKDFNTQWHWHVLGTWALWLALLIAPMIALGGR